MDILKQILFLEYQQGPIHIIAWHLLYLIALFLILAWVLGRFLFRPVLELVEAREERVRNAGRTERESLRDYEKKMDAYRQGLQDARREAYAIREAAQREASQEGDEHLGEVRQAAQGRIREALEGLEAQLARSREQMGEEAGEMARSIAARILGRKEA